MPQKYRSVHKSSSSKIKTIFSTVIGLVLLSGLVAAYLINKGSLDIRNSASVQKGLASIQLGTSKTGEVGKPTYVEVYLSNEINLKSVRLDGKFRGVKIKEAYFESLPQVYPSPIPSSPYPTPYPGTPTPSPYPTTNPSPTPYATSIPVNSIDANKNQLIPITRGSLILTKNKFENNSFVLEYKLSDAKIPWPPTQKHLLGRFVIIPEENGNLNLTWDKGDSKAIVFGTKKDTLNTPPSVTITVGDACKVDSDGRPICDLIFITDCQEGYRYEYGGVDMCGCETPGKCVSDDSSYGTPKPSYSPDPSYSPKPSASPLPVQILNVQ